MLDLAVWPKPILKKEAKVVTVFDDELKFLADQMFETMYAHRGIGLAAPQVNINKQMIVMNVNDNPFVMINPKVVISYPPYEKDEERCLSFPGFLVEVVRPLCVRVEYFGLDEEEFHLVTFQNLESRCVQHEIDHLDGKTFLRYISKVHRDMITAKMKKHGHS